MDPTKRFSQRAADYVKYRPHYPTAALDFLRESYGLTPASKIADIGSGTGLLTKLFLDHGNAVWGVEPNEEMRQAGEAFLSAYPNFTSVNATAEATTLPDCSMDFVTAGQAFHWFQPDLAKSEFRRILRPDGYLVLIWNIYHVEANDFMRAFVSRIFDGYTMKTTQEQDREKEDLNDYFVSVEARRFPNSQTVDFEGLLGRVTSSSHLPMKDHQHYEAMVEELTELFKLHQQNGNLDLIYETEVWVGKI